MGGAGLLERRNLAVFDEHVVKGDDDLAVHGGPAVLRKGIDHEVAV